MDEELMNTEVETTVDETGVDTSSEKNVEVANPTDDSTDSSAEVTTEAQNEEVAPQIDVNAIAAAARRKAEADAKLERERRDAEFEKRFGHLSNPITGQPIRSEADYLAALDAQEEVRARQQLQDNGVDPDMLDKLIANNPRIRQAEAIMLEAQRQQNIQSINNDVLELSKIDPSIKSLADVPPNVIQMAMDSDGLISLTNAYKILNFGKVSDSQQQAITQNAINQAKGKAHMTPVNGVATPDEGVEIPSSELAEWKDMFPDKTASELKALYNKTL